MREPAVKWIFPSVFFQWLLYIGPIAYLIKVFEKDRCKMKSRPAFRSDRRNSASKWFEILSECAFEKSG